MVRTKEEIAADIAQQLKGVTTEFSNIIGLSAVEVLVDIRDTLEGIRVAIKDSRHD